MSKNGGIEYQLHPMRDTLYNELHIRPFHAMASPQQITHLAACCGNPEALQKSCDLVSELCKRYEINPPPSDAVTFYQNFGNFTINWERHVEFYSLTIMQPAPSQGKPFEYTAVDLLPSDWLKQLPGEVLAAFHMIIDNQQLSYDEHALSHNFEGHPVMMSSAYGGKTQILTAFKLHGDGYGRFMICHNGMSTLQTGRLTRRLIDLETYRLLSLLSLPIAKRISPQLLIMDKQMADILNLVAEQKTASSERQLLEKITTIEAQLETYRAETTQRFSATQAYHQLVKDRLERINEEKIDGHLSIGEFINRRLNPALRTCESVQQWMEDLSKRIERASDLMRTRVNLNLQEQNQSQLSAMNRRSRLQFRLQETVEGLSIAAISYYSVGLLSYLFKGLPLEQWGLNNNVLLACSIPVVLTTIWYVTRRIKRRLIQDQEIKA
ncbi:Uncharacterized membrane-anchored protein [Desulfuromusa kysingii]|uniref:Uncharacterized membrane-anchored protein n=1 Tax=Desulfuromusa kysingii TaxID=37625 RepID=A0A1H3Y5I5_9BACT|nr:DUF3422 domain-containing protein [Desulfuromusa kysingii]SEA06925.1 Uncharacterized membrane-anchored protein [Desulfuromusa kysingii]